MTWRVRGLQEIKTLLLKSHAPKFAHSRSQHRGSRSKSAWSARCPAKAHQYSSPIPHSAVAATTPPKWWPLVCPRRSPGLGRVLAPVTPPTSLPKWQLLACSWRGPGPPRFQPCPTPTKVAAVLWYVPGSVFSPPCQGAGPGTP